MRTGVEVFNAAFDAQRNQRLERFDAAFSALKVRHLHPENISANNRRGEQQLFSGIMRDPRDPEGNGSDNMVRFIAIVCKMYRGTTTVPIEVQGLRLIEQPGDEFLVQSSYTIPPRKGARPVSLPLEPVTDIPPTSEKWAINSTLAAVEQVLTEG